MIRALLTSIFCGALIALVHTFEQGLYLSPLFLGLTVGAVNHRKFKINPFAGITVFIFLSYLFFAFSVYLTFGLGEIYSLIEKHFQLPVLDLTTFILFVSGTIISITLYWLYSFFLKDQRKIFGALLVLKISLFIPITVWLASDDNQYTDNEDFAIYQIAWLIYTGLGFGIAINQLEIRKGLKKILGKNK